jgi:hypothetical protein
MANNGFTGRSYKSALGSNGETFSLPFIVLLSRAMIISLIRLEGIMEDVQVISVLPS